MKEGWKYKKLGEVCDKVSNLKWQNVPSNSVYSYVDLTAVDRDSFNITNTQSINRENAPSRAKQIIKQNDVLFGTTRPTLRRVCVVEDKNDGDICSTGFCVLRPKSEIVSSKWVFYQLMAEKYYAYIEPLQSGATYPAVTDAVVKSYIIPIPPISEQQHIVEELDLLSSIIEKKKAQLNELDNLAQSLFYEMFGHLYETAFPIKVLIDICEFIKDGTHQTPTYTDDKVNGVKFLSAKDVVSGYINWENVKLIPFELHQELHKRIAPQRNDLLLCKNGTTGICAIVETDEIFDIYVSLALLRPKKPFCPKYLLYAINNPQTKRQFDESLKGIGVPNLHLGEIKKTKIIFPPLELQQQFASKIEAIEHQKELIQQSIKEVETLFNSRMDYYFN